MIEPILDVNFGDDGLNFGEDNMIDFVFFRVELNSCSAVTVYPAYTRRLEVLIPPIELKVLS